MTDHGPHEGVDPMTSPNSAEQAEKAEIPRAKRQPPKRRCKAHNRQGKQCGQAPAIGQEVCRLHGGASPQAVAKAQQRLRDASDRMAMKLLGMAESENVPAYVALQAINSALDRAGVVEPKQVDVTVGLKYESVFEAAVMESGTRSEFRTAVGRTDPVPELPAPNRPGGEDSGVRVLGTTFDGHAVIDGQVGDSVPPASMQTDDEHLAGDVARGDGQKSRQESLGNVLQPVRLPHGAYLPAEDALEQANAANRDFRRNLGRQ